MDKDLGGIEVFSITAGEYYRYANSAAPKIDSQVYQVIRFATHFPSFQEQVVYRGVTGPEVGKWYICTKNNFVTHFSIATEEDRKRYGLPSVITGETKNG